jgi:hypothetical protein
LVRDCEVLTAAMIPLTPNFQNLFGFAKRDVFRERIFHDYRGFYLFFCLILE